MRHRRAERCLLRAEIALEAGIDEDAREALDEASRLNSENPKLAALRAELDARTASTIAAYHIAQQASRRQRTGRVAAILVLFLAIGGAAFWITRMNAPVVTAPEAAAAAPPATRPLDESPVPVPGTAAIATAGQIDAPPSPPQERMLEPGARGAETAPAEKPAPETAVPNAQQEPGRTGPLMPAFNPQFGPPRPVALPPSSAAPEGARMTSAPAPTPPEPPPPLPESPGATAVSPAALDRMGERLPTSNAPVVESPAAPENPAVREEPRVRAVLSRYEAAYSELDAAAAQAVWPSVDGRSLARAFDTLQSQSVSLGRCSVQVAGTTASADCDGSIRWTPKVGGGSQTSARRWHFELHSGNGTWQIIRADVR